VKGPARLQYEHRNRRTHRDKYEQIVSGSGYDHNFVLEQTAGPTRLAAEAYETTSEITLRILTTEARVQFYREIS